MHKARVFCTSLCIGVFCFGFTQTQIDSLQVQKLKEVVLTDSRFKLSREKSGKVITKITTEQLDQAQGQSVAEIISKTAGIEINGIRSNAGQNLSYFIRGGRNRQVLIMIDGIQVTDPSQIANDYDLRLLNADQVESIEILKGASSTLYGSGAATAVINIKLREASKMGLHIQLRGSLGSNQPSEETSYTIEDFRNSIAIRGTSGNFGYTANFGHQFTDGLSAIENGTESDAFNSYNGNFKFSYKFGNRFSLKSYASFDNFKSEFDDSFSMLDADNLSISKQYRIGLSSDFKYNNGSLRLNAALNTINREIQSSFPSKFEAQSIITDIFNKYNFNDRFYTVLGLNLQNNQMQSSSIPSDSNDFITAINSDNANFTIVDPYVNAVYVSDFGININAGLRLNNHSEYGSHFVYNINPSYRINCDFGYLKGLVSYSTAFITPSLYQLFEPSFGNPDLKPEENQTIEIGAEVSFQNIGVLSIVYFNRQEKNFIDFIDNGGFVFQYQNINKSFSASGLELVAQLQFNDKFNFNANLTYTKVEESLSLRIPDIKINSQLNYTAFDNTLLSLSYQYNGERKDAFFNMTTFESEQVDLNAFGLLDFYVSQKILKNKMTIFASLNNLLNEDYQELFGFTTLGRNFRIGFNLEI